MVDRIRIGTRGSRLAQIQTELVIAALRKAHPELTVEVVTIQTSGDWRPDQGETKLLESAGGKGQFAKEIEEAILAGRIDCGVHSLKDMPAYLPEGLLIETVLPAEDPRDVFISYKYKSLADLPAGAVVGTSSARRQAFVLAKRPDLKVATLRGNVNTRLEKIRAGQVDASFLAMAGLNRLGLAAEVTQILEPQDFLPACGQGIVAVEVRADNEAARKLLAPIHDRVTGLRAQAERAVLQVIDGSCHTPIGVYATLVPGKMMVAAQLAQEDGSELFSDQVEGPVSTDDQARALGTLLGNRLEPKIPADLLKK